MKRVLFAVAVLLAGLVAGVLAALLYQHLSAKNTPAATAAAPMASAPIVLAQPSAPVARPQAVPSPQRKAAPSNSGRAVVLGVKPVSVSEQSTRTECQDVQVERQAPVQDQHRITGTVVGSAIGGVLGHQAGGGRGKEAMTALGAVVGGVAGNQVQGHMQKKDTYTDTERRCVNVPVETAKIIGYDVRYSFHGQTRSVRMDHDPGSALQIRNGQPVID